jgi:hypothetical protein
MFEYKFLNWIPPEFKPSDDDDIDLDSSNAQFKLMAHMIHYALPQMTPTEFLTKHDMLD